MVIWISPSFILALVTTKQKSAHLVLAENSLISAGRDQEIGEGREEINMFAQTCSNALFDLDNISVVLNHNPPIFLVV